MEKVIKFKTERKWVQTLVADVQFLAKTSREARGIFRMGLSGGETPRSWYQALASLPDFPWEKTELYLVDERMVPLDHEYSNFRMVQETLIEKLPHAPKKFVYFDTGLTTDETLFEYQKHLNTVESCFFDLILLGIGADGHTASLFPNSRALSVTDQWIMKTEAFGKPFVERYTLTYPALESSREIYFLLRGKEKEGILEKLQTPGPENLKIPAAKIFHLSQAKVFYCFT